MNKNIALLTFHFSDHNYGAVLQTYASVTMLKKLGYKPYVVNFGKSKMTKDSRFLIRYIDQFLNPFNRFRNKYLPLTNYIQSERELNALNKKFEVFYVGSDQVWRQEFAQDKLLAYFLNFVDNNKLKISYAASFGKEHIDYAAETKAEVAKLIKRFDAVSVREDSGVEICHKEFGVNAVKVLDPTLMLDESDYKMITKNGKSNSKSKYIAYYELGYSTSVSERAQEFITNLNLPVNNIYRQEINLVFRKITPYNSISNWLNSIKHAGLVITNSYHCVIFSIIFKRNFIVLSSEYGGNTRLISLLKDLGLSDRIFEKYEKNRVAQLQPIEYKMVYEKLENLRNISYNYLEIIK